jgi:hypothetical protein
LSIEEAVDGSCERHRLAKDGRIARTKWLTAFRRKINLEFRNSGKEDLTTDRKKLSRRGAEVAEKRQNWLMFLAGER